jgi:hypothetical protein
MTVSPRRRRRGGAWLAVALGLSLIAACSAAPSQTAAPPSGEPSATLRPTATPESIPSPSVPGSIGEALVFVGMDARTLAFTDWRQIKAAVGAPNLTSSASFDEKWAALAPMNGSQAQGLLPTEATVSGFGISMLKDHAHLWGFDLFDLDWELRIEREGAPAMWVLRFSDGFDVSSLQKKLDAYGFTIEQLARGQLRSADVMRLRTTDSAGNEISLFGTSELVIGNVGFLDDGRTLVMSWDPREPDAGEAAVRDILTNGIPDAADLSLRSAASLLFSPSSAFLRVGSDWCRSFGPAPGTAPDVQAAVDALLAEAGAVHAYNVFVVGYNSAGDPVGQFILGYADGADATADLDARRLLADEGISSQSRAGSILRYADHHFSLVDARAEQRSIVMDVAPFMNMPRQLFNLAIQRDLLFAACPA